ncbi:oligosaccharide flippase family protein [Chloroflexi bacterium TSY]|nr:oligosaccharide flippase family protein [Chloroflexi bacterium TSY]
MLTNITNRLDLVTRGWLTLLSGTIARFALSFLAGVLLARTLGPTGYGTYSLIGAFVGIVAVISDFGLSQTIVKEVASNRDQHPEIALTRARVFYWLRIGLAGVATCFVIVGSGLISEGWLGLPGMAGLLSLAALGLVVSALNGSMSALFQSIERFDRISIVMLVTAGAETLVALLLAATGQLSLTSAILGISIGTTLLGFIVGVHYLKTDWTITVGRPTTFPGLKSLCTESSSLFRFGLWLWLANILTIVGARLDLFLVSYWLSPVDVGLYVLALNLSYKLNFVNHSLYPALIPAASALKDRDAVRQYLGKGIIRSSAIGIVVLLVIPLATWLVPWIYGSPYRGTVDLLQMLSLIVVLDTFALPIRLLFYTFDRSDIPIWEGFAQVSVFLFASFWLIPLWGTTGAVASRLCGHLAGMIITFGLISKEYVKMAYSQ